MFKNDTQIIRKAIKVSIVLILTFTIANSYSNPHWQCLKTNNFKVFYTDSSYYQAEQVLQILEYYRPQVESFTGNTVSGLPIVLNDLGRVVNGMAHPLFTTVLLNTTSPSSSTLRYSRNWWSMVGVHEYTHILHLTKSSEFPGLLRIVFGNIMQPNMYSPLLVIEGFATYVESNLIPFQGRLQDGYFESVTGAEIYDHNFPDIITAVSAPLDVPLNSSYLFGSQFIEFLAEEYGKESLSKFFSYNGSSVFAMCSPVFPGIGIDNSAIRAFGKSLPVIWEDWKKHLRKEYSDWNMEGEKITDHGWNIQFTGYFQDIVYYSRTYPIKSGPFSIFWFNEIIAFDPKNRRSEKIISTTSNFSQPFHLKHQKLYYVVSEISTGHPNSSNLSQGMADNIRMFDLISKRDYNLFTGEIRAFSPLQDETIIYSVDKKNNFGSRVYLFEPEFKRQSLLFETEFLINEIRADKGRIVVSARKDWENFGLFELDLVQKNLVTIFDSPYYEGSVSLYGDSLFFSANIDGAYRSYCYDFSTKNISRLTENGYSDSPIYHPGEESVYYIGLNTAGKDLYRKQAIFEPIIFNRFHSASTPDFSKLNIRIEKGGYADNLKTLFPKIRFPYLYADNDDLVVGCFAIGSDAVQDFPIYSTILQANLKKKRMNFYVNIISNYLSPIQSNVFYTDLFGKAYGIEFRTSLFNKRSSGLNNVSTGIALIQELDNDQTALTPSVMSNFNWSKTKLLLQLETEIERKSQLSEFAWTLQSYLKQYIYKSEFVLDLKLMRELNNPHAELGDIRGYTLPLYGEQGIAAKSEFTFPFYSIRNGFWNPNIYCEDLFFTSFLDIAINDKWARQIALGLELHTEMKMFFGMLPLDMGLRVSRNIDDEVMVLFFIVPKLGM